MEVQPFILCVCVRMFFCSFCQVVEEDDWLSRRLAELTVQTTSSSTAAAPTADEDIGIDFGDSDIGTSASAAGDATGMDANGIDFGEGFSMDAIDLGDVPSGQTTDLADIDFGDLVIDDSSVSAAADATSAADDTAGIDFDIVVEESGTSSEQGTCTWPRIFNF